MDDEEVLAGGNVADRVARIGATVRKPATPGFPAVAALLTHLAAVGFEGSPRHLGLDSAGRQVIEFVPGVTADRLPVMDVGELTRLGELIRSLHDATSAFTPPADAHWQVAIPPDRQDLICHNDLAPRNLVRDGARWVFIDWDGAGPGSRLWDLGYAAHGFVPLHAGGDPAIDGVRLRAIVDGYGLHEGPRGRRPVIHPVSRNTPRTAGAHHPTHPWDVRTAGTRSPDRGSALGTTVGRRSRQPLGSGCGVHRAEHRKMDDRSR
jgi:hypothetical protein